MQSVSLLASVALLLWLVGLDLRERRLPNLLVGIYGALFPVATWGAASLADWQVLGWHIGVAALAFIVLFFMYLLGAMGGGDVKFGTAVLLWAGPGLALPVVTVVAWSGGVLAVVGWLLDRKAWRRLRWRPLRLARHALSPRRGVPYGVALACGGMFVLWQQYRVIGAM